MTRRRLLTIATPVIVVTALTVLVTWPQSLHLATHVSAHDDPLFSMWRLAWVAHAIGTDPRRLFDANIFHPATNTLSYSDAMLLEGVTASPLLWIGASPIAVYNILLLGGFVASGLAMFVLVRHLTGRIGPALVSSAIFTVAPYRIEHFMHLELQWAMFVPLTLWSIHRTIERRSWRDGLLAGLFLWLQILSSVYYGVFLAIAAFVLVLLMLAADPRPTVRALGALAAGGILTTVLAVPYAIPYLQTAGSFGTRKITEVSTYSATAMSYLASPLQSLLWGWTAARWGGVELSLFPGAITIALVLAAAFYRPRRVVLVYLALAAMMIEASFGLNGFAYSWLFRHVSALHGLRSPSRFGIIALCALSVLAGFGAGAVEARIGAAGPGRAVALVTAFLSLIAIDNATTGMWIAAPPYQPASAFNVYKTIRALGPGPIVELPLSPLDALPGREPTYEFWSIAHWHPILNGYSGYYPREFAETVVRMEGFPDDRSMAQLAYTGVRYIVVHRAFYEPDDYQALLNRISLRPELRPHGRYPDPSGECQLFVLGK